MQTIKGVVMDMDGVLWRGDTPLPGMQAFMAFLRAQGVPFALATNNSSKSPADYINKLAHMGVLGVQAGQIINSGIATAHYLQTHYPAGTRVHILGMAGLRRVIEDAGFVLADDDVRVVVSGIDFDLTYARAKQAALLIRAGADFVGTNGDKTFPAPEGLVPGAGALLAFIEAATDVQPIVIGKPGPAMFQAALAAIGTAAAETLMIGDRLNTDIEGARNAGMQTALMLTGVSTREELAASPLQPDAVFEDLPSLQQVLTENAFRLA